MSTLSDSLHRRVVSRFLGGSQDRQAFFWKLPATKPHISDDIVLRCSSGCTLSAVEVEQMLPKRLNVAPGSCRIRSVTADAETNKTRFEAATTAGRRITGTITVNIVASDRRLDAFSVVDLDA